MKNLLIIGLLISICGCSIVKGNINYSRPGEYSDTKNEMVYDSGKDVIWKALIPELGKSFFVINNIDKESGLINVSYSGDPEKYVDCGHVDLWVENLSGKRTYSFSGSRGYVEYENANNGRIYHLKRKMTLDGRINIIVRDIDKDKTSVMVNTKYIVNLAISAYDGAGNYIGKKEHSIGFNTGERKGFSTLRTECVANGNLENSILSLIK